MFQSNYDPFEQYLDWQRTHGLGIANIVSGLLPNSVSDWSVNPEGLKAVGAPQPVVNLAQQEGQPGNNAMQFLEGLRALVGQQLQQRFPGIERTDLNTPRSGFAPGATSFNVRGLTPGSPSYNMGAQQFNEVFNLLNHQKDPNLEAALDWLFGPSSLEGIGLSGPRVNTLVPPAPGTLGGARSSGYNWYGSGTDRSNIIG